MIPKSKFKVAAGGCLGHSSCPCEKVGKKINDDKLVPGLVEKQGKWSEEPEADSGPNRNRTGMPGLVDGTGRRWAGED